MTLTLPDCWLVMNTPCHAHRRARRPVLHPPPAAARHAHPDPRVQQAQRSVHREPRAEDWRQWLHPQGPPSEEIMKAFEKLRDGAPYLSHELASAVAFMEARGKTTNPLRAITVRELQTLSLLAEGKPYAQIATDLHVSYK